MVLFGFLGWLATVVGLTAAVLHLLYVAITGRKNEDVMVFLSDVGTYVRDIFAYLSFATDKKPFPLDEEA